MQLGTSVGSTNSAPIMNAGEEEGRYSYSEKFDITGELTEEDDNLLAKGFKCILNNREKNFC